MHPTNIAILQCHYREKKYISQKSKNLHLGGLFMQHMQRFVSPSSLDLYKVSQLRYMKYSVKEILQPFSRNTSLFLEGYKHRDSSACSVKRTSQISMLLSSSSHKRMLMKEKDQGSMYSTLLSISQLLFSDQGMLSNGASFQILVYASIWTSGLHLESLLMSFTNLPPATVTAIFLWLHLFPASLIVWPFILGCKRQSAPPPHIIHSLKSHNCPSVKSSCLPNHSPQGNYSNLKDPCKKKLYTLRKCFVYCKPD